MASVLTAKAVEAAKPGAARREIPDAALPGLYLVVQPSGARSWALRYRFDGRPAKLTIGPVLDQRKGEEVDGPMAMGQPMTLTEARRAARDALQTLAEGKDPGAVKKAASAARKASVAGPDADRDHVRKLSAAFVTRYCKPRNRAWQEVERQFRREINDGPDGKPMWGDRRVQDITKRDVLDLLDGIIDRGSPVTANRVFATLRTFFNWLVERGVIDDTPTAKLKKPTEEKARERVLTDSEIRLFWRATEGFEYPFGPMWRLLLLTGQRRNEIAGMRRDELALDGEEPLWTLPGSRTKNGRLHLVPLAPVTAEIIRGLPVIGKKGFVFTTTGETSVSGFSRSKGRLDAAMLEAARKEAEEAGKDPATVTLEPFTLHDLRRTMVSGMARLRINLPVIEKAVNHTSGTFDGIVAVYQHHDFLDERRAAFEAWANFIADLVAEKHSDNVVPLRAAK